MRFPSHFASVTESSLFYPIRKRKLLSSFELHFPSITSERRCGCLGGLVPQAFEVVTQRESSMRIRQILTIIAVVGTFVSVGLAQDASSFKTLYSFTGQLDGGDSVAGLVIGSGGVLYGATNSGGTSNLGTVFELVPPAPGGVWTETVLHNFSGGTDGANPNKR